MPPSSKKLSDPANQEKRADGIVKKPVAAEARSLAGIARQKKSAPDTLMLTPAKMNGSADAEDPDVQRRTITGDTEFAFPKNSNSQQLAVGSIKKESHATAEILPPSSSEHAPTSARVAGTKRHPTFLPTLGIGIGGALAILIVLSTLFARVTLTVRPVAQIRHVQNVPVSFDANTSQADEARNIIPAEFLEFKDSAREEFSASGTLTTEAFSRGNVRIYNNFGTAPQPLVARTRFLTMDGYLYRLPIPIVIPGAKMENGRITPQYIETELVADKPGPEFNIRSDVTLTIPGFQGTPKHEGFYAKTVTPFAGGGSGGERAVTEQDIALAQERATKRLFNRLKEEVAKKIPPHLTVAEGLREIQITGIDAPVPGTAGEHFAVEAHAVARVVIFREEDVFALLRNVLLGDDTGTHALMPESADLRYRLATLDADKKIAHASIGGEIKIKRLFSEDEIKRMVSGRNEQAIIDMLGSRDEFDSVRVHFFPPWLLKAPTDIDKIHLIIVEPSPK